VFERKATRTLSSNIDHHIAMCRVLLPVVTQNQSVQQHSTIAAQHNRQGAFKLCLEIPLLHLILAERFPDAVALQ
jgi:hypothetical protein